ncbi:hypothetical protein RYH80_18450 [Halobaculum sp. MBLA0147]|uniref:hypothetical protein n=1 Tax=Halobaculum sp. MBLA0147 TaxID=3079934 RepID=UPI0035231E46
MPETTQITDDDLVEGLAGSLGEDKASELVSTAKTEAGVHGTAHAKDDAMDVLDAVGEIADSRLASVAANSTKTQLR